MKIKIIDVNAQNCQKFGFFCTKNNKSDAFKAKLDWFKSNNNDSVRIKLAVDENNKQLGFIEFTDSEKAWRPIIARNYLFINCIMVKSKKDRNKNIGTFLIKEVENEAKKRIKPVFVL